MLSWNSLFVFSFFFYFLVIVNVLLKRKVTYDYVDKIYHKDKVKYIAVRNFEEGEVISDLIEIDINQAYWETAYMMGVISKEIFKKGLDMDKLVRLAALGSLAKKTEVWHYDGKDSFKKEKVINDQSTNNVWFAICQKVGDVMQEALKESGDDFMFYWVDAIFIKNNHSTAAKVTSVFNRNGYETKNKLIDRIEFMNNEFKVYSIRKDDDPRLFSYPNSNKVRAKDIIENSELIKFADSIFWPKKSKIENGSILLGIEGDYDKESII